MTSYPANLRYTKEHEWCLVEGDIATIGITAFAVERLGGDITLVEVADEGTDVQHDESFGTIESVKAASDLYAPLSGVVSAVNEELMENPELVAESPYDRGWMVKIRFSDPAELKGLMNADAYAASAEETDE